MLHAPKAGVDFSPGRGPSSAHKERNSPESGLAALESEYFIDGVAVEDIVVVVVVATAVLDVGAGSSGKSRPIKLDLISFI